MSDDISIHRGVLLSSVEMFAKYTFQAMNNRPYEIGQHHRQIASALDDVVKGKIKKLLINIAPRYGKTLLVSQLFVAYGLAINPKSNFLLLSYSQNLAQENSVAVRDILQSDYYSLLFGERTSVKFGASNKAKWKTTQGGGVYATTPLGQVTGFGAGQFKSDIEENLDEFMRSYNPANFGGAIVIDDPLTPDDAFSDTVRERVNLRFETTIRNRVNNRDVPIIVVMQRLHENDLCGYLQNLEDDWNVLKLPCISYVDGKEVPLWGAKHSLEELHKIEAANSFVFETQYMQNPKPLEGLMYREFRRYSTLPSKGVMKNYTDSADTGEDYLCSICYFETNVGMFVTDVLFTQKPMEYTENAMAIMLSKNAVEQCVVETNGSGRVFMRNVERICREMGNLKTSFKGLTQSANKEVRIFTNSNEVNNLIFMPEGWQQWREFHSQITSFRKVGKNAHDDAPDALTGMVELFRKNGKFDKKSIYNKVF